jgi:hypothetical protein
MSAPATPESATTGCRGEPGSGETQVSRGADGQTCFRVSAGRTGCLLLLAQLMRQAAAALGFLLRHEPVGGWDSWPECSQSGEASEGAFAAVACGCPDRGGRRRHQGAELHADREALVATLDEKASGLSRTEA